jgi:plastocyanin
VRTIGFINGVIAAALGALLITACGGSSTTPSPAPGGGSGATVTITSAGVNPSQVSISVGQTVTFVNNDSRSHDIESDPHPAHTDCPAINQVDTLQPGQSKQTGPLTTARTCGYHDHSDPGNGALKGSITIR